MKKLYILLTFLFFYVFCTYINDPSHVANAMQQTIKYIYADSLNKTLKLDSVSLKRDITYKTLEKNVKETKRQIMFLDSVITHPRR